MTSSISRITHHSMARTVLAGLQGNLDRMGKYQEQLSTGRLISRPSDSPTGTVQSFQIRREVRANAQYSRNATDGIGWLSTLDTTLTSSFTQMQRVRELTLQGMSTGVSSTESRESIASEMDALRDSLLAMGNSTYLDRPVFGGTTPGKVAYDGTGNFVGDTNDISRTVGSNISVRVNLNGPEVFGSAGNDLFTVVSEISTHLRTDPSALGNDLDRLDSVMSKVKNALADVGARQSRMEAMQTLADDRGTSLKSSLADVEDIDLPETIVQLQLQQTAYQAALGATSRVLQPSLVDFLK